MTETGLPLRRRVLRVAGALAALLLTAAMPWWGPAALSELAYFRVRRVEVVGTRFLPASEVLARLDVDTAASIWRELASLERRVAQLPQVESVSIARRLPATLVVRVRERPPIALLPFPGGLRALAAGGEELPIDPTRHDLDLPVIASHDTAVLRLLAELRQLQPGLYGRVSAVRPTGRDELAIDVPPLTVRALHSLTVARLAEILPVERDLARRRVIAYELDLRYRDQVVARFK
ncbi:MAG: FtsQ-type POTRA domain-containing protein [Gemmatimonadaceae bacterium]